MFGYTNNTKSAKMSQKRWKSIWAACQGIWLSWQLGRNMRIHILAATLVLGIALQANLPNSIRALLTLTVVSVVSMETMNTALERAVNLVTADYHPLAKQAKDLAAAAVLIVAIGSIAVGVFIVLEYYAELTNFISLLWHGPRPLQWAWLAFMIAQVLSIIRWREPA